VTEGNLLAVGGNVRGAAEANRLLIGIGSNEIGLNCKKGEDRQNNGPVAYHGSKSCGWSSFPQAAATSDPEYRRDYQITAGNVTRAFVRYPILSTGPRTCQGKSRKIGATGKIAMGLGIRTDTLLVVSRPRGLGRAETASDAYPPPWFPNVWEPHSRNSVSVASRFFAAALFVHLFAI